MASARDRDVSRRIRPPEWREPLSRSARVRHLGGADRRSDDPACPAIVRSVPGWRMSKPTKYAPARASRPIGSLGRPLSSSGTALAGTASRFPSDSRSQDDRVERRTAPVDELGASGVETTNSRVDRDLAGLDSGQRADVDHRRMTVLAQLAQRRDRRATQAVATEVATVTSHSQRASASPSAVGRRQRRSVVFASAGRGRRGRRR